MNGSSPASSSGSARSSSASTSAPSPPARGLETCAHRGQPRHHRRRLLETCRPSQAPLRHPVADSGNSPAGDPRHAGLRGPSDFLGAVDLWVEQFRLGGELRLSFTRSTSSPTPEADGPEQPDQPLALAAAAHHPRGEPEKAIEHYPRSTASPSATSRMQALSAEGRAQLFPTCSDEAPANFRSVSMLAATVAANAIGKTRPVCADHESAAIAGRAPKAGRLAASGNSSFVPVRSLCNPEQVLFHVPQVSRPDHPSRAQRPPLHPALREAQRGSTRRSTTPRTHVVRHRSEDRGS